MNFYKHHLGDYDGATMHLSWDEDMAYTRLLRVYYRDERPIPVDRKAAYRLVRAQSKAQRDAVDQVLNEFFEQQVDGWHNKRCDEEIAAAQAQAQTNRRIAANRGRNGHESLNGSSHESLTNGPPIQTPDSNSQTPISPTLPSPDGGGMFRETRAETRKDRKAEAEIAWKRLTNSDGRTGDETTRACSGEFAKPVGGAGFRCASPASTPPGCKTRSSQGS